MLELSDLKRTSAPLDDIECDRLLPLCVGSNHLARKWVLYYGYEFSAPGVHHVALGCTFGFPLGLVLTPSTELGGFVPRPNVPRSRQESTLGGHIVKNLSIVPTPVPGRLAPVLARTFSTKVVVDLSYGPACRLPFARVCKPDLPLRFGLCEFGLWQRGATEIKDAREGCCPSSC